LLEHRGYAYFLKEILGGVKGADYSFRHDVVPDRSKFKFVGTKSQMSKYPVSIAEVVIQFVTIPTN